MLRLVSAAAAAAAVLVLSLPAEASAPPVGKLPPGPVSTIRAPRGTLVAIALPKHANGLVWRLARRVDPKVLVESGEGDLAGSVVVTYRAVSPGHVVVAYALTRGESSVARQARRFDVTVTR